MIRAPRPGHSLATAAAAAILSTATQSDAISEGNPSDHRFTVFMRGTRNDGSKVHCSGTLVTPRWVLTSNHCVTGDGWGVDATVEVTIPVGDSTPNPDNAALIADGRVFFHTAAVSGNIKVLKPTGIDPLSNDDSSRDLALVKLDTRVPFSKATPLHPPILGVPECFENVDFEGLIVGFGDTLWADSESWWDASEPPARRWQSSEGYYHQSHDYGGTYDVYWAVPPPPINPEWYYGILAGDSGGPLERRSRRSESDFDHLCGWMDRVRVA